MDASKITELLQKQNTRYSNRCQTIDSSTLIWKNQIQSSTYIKGVKTCEGEQNWNVPTNPECPSNLIISNGIGSVGCVGRTHKIVTVYSGAEGSASRVYSSDIIMLQKAGKQSCSIPNPSNPSNSYIVLPGGNPLTSNAELQVPSSSYICNNTNGPVNGSIPPINNNLNMYLPEFDTYYAMKH